MKQIGATEFKAKCLALLDEVARTGEVLTVLKRRKPVAHLIPAMAGSKGYAQAGLKGTVKIVGDVVSPVLVSEACEAETNK